MSGEQAIREAGENGEVIKPDSVDRDSDMARACGEFTRNDLGNAQRLITRHGDDIISVTGVGWFVWDGIRWAHDPETVAVQLRAQDTARTIFAEIDALAAGRNAEWRDGHLKWAVRSGASSSIHAMMREAAPNLAKNPDELDRHQYLFNCANGTLGLGDKVTLRPHNRADLLTRASAVEYDPKADCPMFREFLDEILPDRDVQAFLQCWFGYVMTGATSEQVVVLFHGLGANGKSTLMTAIIHCMGDYALTLPFASLLHDDRRRGSEATPDLARLPGARLVTAAEPETGSRFSESMIKSMTGSEQMTVRHLNKGFFEFSPEFKLNLSFNNRPQVRGQDEGIWRRLLLVPFEISIPIEQRDRNLDAKLAAEAPGILNWMIGGFKRWCREGLVVPFSIKAATESYRTDSDPIGQFLADRTRDNPTARVQATNLYRAYEKWCKDTSVEPVSRTLFGRILGDKRVPKEKSGSMFYVGIELIEEPEFHGDGNIEGAG